MRTASATHRCTHTARTWARALQGVPAGRIMGFGGKGGLMARCRSSEIAPDSDQASVISEASGVLTCCVHCGAAHNGRGATLTAGKANRFQLWPAQGAFEPFNGALPAGARACWHTRPHRACLADVRKHCIHSVWPSVLLHRQCCLELVKLPRWLRAIAMPVQAPVAPGLDGGRRRQK